MMERINCSDTAMMTKPSEHGATAKPMVAATRISGMSTSAATASAGFSLDVDVNMIFPWVGGWWSYTDAGIERPGSDKCGVITACFSSIKSFADQLFAFLPKRLCVLRIEGVRL